MVLSALDDVRFTDVACPSGFRLFLSPFVTEDVPASCKEFPVDDKLFAPGTEVGAYDVQLDENGQADLAAVVGKDIPPKTRGLLVGRLDAAGDGVAFLGAGADWWWTCWVNGELAGGRSQAFADGNLKSSFSKADWIFPVKVRKGPNLVVFHLCSGTTWKIGIGAFPAASIPRETILRENEEALRIMLAAMPAAVSALSVADLTASSATISYRMDSPYPAGLRYRVRGSDEWKSLWHMPGDSKTFRLGGLSPDTDYEARPLRFAFHENRFEAVPGHNAIPFRTTEGAVQACEEGEAPYEPPSYEGLSLFGTTSENPVSFAVGEPIDFYFTVKCENRAKLPSPLFLSWAIRGDDGQNRIGFEPISLSRPVHLQCRLARPGFVRVTASLTDCSASFPGLPELSFDGGAGADVAEIRPASIAPADMDDYWRRQRERLDAVPLRFEVVPLADRRFPDGMEVPQGLDAFAVRIDCAGPSPVTGYLTAPSAPGRYPARCHFDGYKTIPQTSHRDPLPGWISFHVNAHGYELNRDADYYAAFFKPFQAKNPNYGFSPEENADPDTSYFNGMALRVMRAFDYLKTRADWNGKDLVAVGGSQGGLQAVWAGSLVEGLTLCDTSITWGSNIAGASLDHRMPGWQPEYARGLDYYDSCFHAARIPSSCRVIVSRAGLGDYVCPPSGVTAMYNSVKTRKAIAYYQNSGHMYIPEPPSYI